MTPEIVSELRARMQSQPRSLTELHRAAAAAGSAWSEDQVAVLLACLPDVEHRARLYSASAREDDDPIAKALLEIVGSDPVPVALLIKRMPRGLVVTPAALCEVARQQPDLELVGPNRIRRKA